MLISGTEPSSVAKLFNNEVKEMKRDSPKVPKQGEAKRDGVTVTW